MPTACGTNDRKQKAPGGLEDRVSSHTKLELILCFTVLSQDRRQDPPLKICGPSVFLMQYVDVFIYGSGSTGSFRDLMYAVLSYIFCVRGFFCVSNP